jgi:hypothetical protein
MKRLSMEQRQGCGFRMARPCSCALSRYLEDAIQCFCLHNVLLKAHAPETSGADQL